MKETDIFKQKLEKELKTLEQELSGIAEKNAHGGWDAIETEIDSDHADDNDVADNMESFEENRAIVEKLAAQYSDVEAALGKIKAGTYGTCDVCGERIPEKRLTANPAARTCIAHAK